MAIKKHRFWRFLYKLHRYIGLISAVVLLMLAITGIALNHTEDLQLDSQMIQSPIILDWYGIHPPENHQSFATTNHWLNKINQQLYFDNALLLEDENNLIGAIETDEYVIAALNNSLLLLSLNGELLEQTRFEAIERIGTGQQKTIVIQSNTGIFYSEDALLSWHPYSNKSIVWSAGTLAPESISSAIKNSFRTSILPWERVLLDLHSGRLFGSIGVFIVDLSGVCLIILSLSGCLIWIKHKLRSLMRN